MRLPAARLRGLPPSWPVAAARAEAAEARADAATRIATLTAELAAARERAEQMQPGRPAVSDPDAGRGRGRRQR